VLVGPYGSGRRTQANALAKKYGVVNVSMSMLLKEAVANESMLGVAIKPHLVKKSKSRLLKCGGKPLRVVQQLI